MNTNTTPDNPADTASMTADSETTGEVRFNMAGRSVMLDMLDSDDPLAEKIANNPPTADIPFTQAELQRLVGMVSNVSGGSASFLTVRHNILMVAREVGATPELNLN